MKVHMKITLRIIVLWIENIAITSFFVYLYEPFFSLQLRRKSKAAYTNMNNLH